MNWFRAIVEYSNIGVSLLICNGSPLYKGNSRIGYLKRPCLAFPPPWSIFIMISSYHVHTHHVFLWASHSLFPTMNQSPSTKLIAAKRGEWLPTEVGGFWPIRLLMLGQLYMTNFGYLFMLARDMFISFLLFYWLFIHWILIKFKCLLNCRIMKFVHSKEDVIHSLKRGRHSSNFDA